MNARYEAAIRALAAKGIRAEFQRPHQLALPGRVWLTWNRQWYICTWTPACYPVPPQFDVVALCEECLKYEGSPFYEIPEEITRRYGLNRMSDEEFERVCLIPEGDDEDE